MALNLKRDNGQEIKQSINLVKAKRGQSINLQKIAPSLSKVLIVLTWEGDADLDSSLVLLDDKNKPVSGNVVEDKDLGNTPRALVYYNNLDNTNGIVHGGDLRSGGQEEIDIDLNAIDKDINQIIHIATSCSEDGSKTSFEDVSTAKVSIVDADKNEAILEYDLVENAGMATSVEIAKIYNKSGSWMFGSMESVVGDSENGLSDIAAKYFN